MWNELKCIKHSSLDLGVFGWLCCFGWLDSNTDILQALLIDMKIYLWTLWFCILGGPWCFSHFCLFIYLFYLSEGDGSWCDNYVDYAQNFLGGYFKFWFSVLLIGLWPSLKATLACRIMPQSHFHVPNMCPTFVLWAGLPPVVLRIMLPFLRVFHSISILYEILESMHATYVVSV